MKPISQHKILEELENKILETLFELSLIRDEKTLKPKTECHVITSLINITYSKNNSLQKILRSPDKHNLNVIKGKSWGTTSFLFILSQPKFANNPLFFIIALN